LNRISAHKSSGRRNLYDSIGRLSREEEYRGDNPNALVYRNNYDYDRFGNLFREQAKNANALPTA
jgi:hypothetical protein